MKNLLITVAVFTLTVVGTAQADPFAGWRDQVNTEINYLQTMVGWQHHTIDVLTDEIQILQTTLAHNQGSINDAEFKSRVEKLTIKRDQDVAKVKEWLAIAKKADLEFNRVLGIEDKDALTFKDSP